jgi:DNA-directed RNA polymerase sigma subunit (sigma70/sigma32)
LKTKFQMAFSVRLSEPSCTILHVSRLDPYGQETPFFEPENSNEFDNAYFMNEFDSETNVVNIRTALRTLPDRQRLILEKRFGIQGKAQPLSDIAKDFGLSCETIRKDQNAAFFALSNNCSLKTLVA